MFSTFEQMNFDMKKITKIIIFSTIGVVLLLFIGKASGVFGKPDKMEVETDLVKKRTITEIITANGKVQPEMEVKISSDVSGEIVELYIKEGEMVKEGDILLKIRPDIYQSNLDRMNAGLSSTRANLANAEARLEQSKAIFQKTDSEFKRNKSLFDQKAISLSEYEQSNANYLSTKADVEASDQNVKAAIFAVKSSEASLKEAKENLQKTTIYAPMTGTISKLSVEKGERVVGTNQMSGTELLRIANLNNMEVIVDVNENDIVKVHLNDSTIIEIDAYPGKKFKGIVTEIANSSKNTGTSISTDQVTNFEVKILISRNSYKELLDPKNVDFSPFRPGMSATVDIQTKTVKNVLTVPIQAVTTRSDTSKVFGISEEGKYKDSTSVGDKDPIELVFVLDKDNKVKIKEVKTGVQDADFIEIIKGLSEKDAIISGPYSAVSKKLEKGMSVTKKKNTELKK